MSYEIPKEIKSPVKIIFSLQLVEFFIILMGSLIILNVISPSVHEYLQIPYYIISFSFLIYCIWNSNSNQGRKNYQSLVYLIKRDKKTYHPINIVNDLEEEENGEEANKR